MTVATMDDWNTKHDHISAPCRQAKYLSQMHCMTRQVSTIASVITEKMCIIVVMYGVCFVCTNIFVCLPTNLPTTSTTTITIGTAVFFIGTVMITVSDHYARL